MSYLQQFIIGWISLRQQRQALIGVLAKPDDHLLRDVGLSREEASQLVSYGLMAWFKNHGRVHANRFGKATLQPLSDTPRCNCYPLN